MKAAPRAGWRRSPVWLTAETGCTDHAFHAAWLVLSERAPELNDSARSQRSLAPLLELVHKQRQRARPGHKLARADSQFACELGACALLGEALFGSLIRLSFTGTDKTTNSSSFQRRLAQLLATHG